MLPCAAVATRMIALTMSAGTTGDVLYWSCWKIRNPALVTHSWRVCLTWHAYLTLESVLRGLCTQKACYLCHDIKGAVGRLSFAPIGSQ